MEVVKVIGIAFITLIVTIMIRQYKPEFGVYASVIGGALILIMVLDKLSGVITLLTNLSNKVSYNNKFIIILLKITGITFLTEFAASICKDTGESAIANKVDLAGKVMIVSLSLPIISSLLETVLKILP